MSFTREDLDPQSLTILLSNGGENVVAVRPAFVRACYGNANAALLLSQMIFKSIQYANAENDGWFYYRQEDIEENTGLGGEAQNKSRKRLVSMGLLEEKTGGMPRRNYYRVNLKKTVELLVNFTVKGLARSQSPGLAPSQVTGLSPVTSDRAKSVTSDRAKSVTSDRAKSVTLLDLRLDSVLDPPPTPPIGTNQEDSDSGHDSESDLKSGSKNNEERVRSSDLGTSEDVPPETSLSEDTSVIPSAVPGVPDVPMPDPDWKGFRELEPEEQLFFRYLNLHSMTIKVRGREEPNPVGWASANTLRRALAVIKEKNPEDKRSYVLAVLKNGMADEALSSIRTHPGGRRFDMERDTLCVIWGPEFEGKGYTSAQCSWCGIKVVQHPRFPDRNQVCEKCFNEDRRVSDRR